MQEVIEVNNLTKDYSHGRGIYDVSFQVKKGETLGFLGPNGAGKSTTMRHLMGFTAPQKGGAWIEGFDCRKEYEKVLENVGYLPGEVVLPDGINGKGFLNMMQGLQKVQNEERLQMLLQIFPIDLKQNVKRMSVGEKRKLAVIAAFMSDSDIYLLDEPTSGLDPVMQEKFIEFIREEKKRGKTILLSSHIFSEVEALCDRIAISKEGKIISVIDAEEVKHGLRKVVQLTFSSKEDYRRFLYEKCEFTNTDDQLLRADLVMEDAQTNEFLSRIVDYQVEEFIEKPVTLEDYFMHFYKDEREFGGLGDGR